VITIIAILLGAGVQDLKGKEELFLVAQAFLFSIEDRNM
jgi:hypothetical protein